MVVFRKKRFFLIFLCLVVSFCTFFATSNDKIDISNRSYEITQVSALPVSQKVVVLDAGHGGEDGGAVRGFWDC